MRIWVSEERVVKALYELSHSVQRPREAKEGRQVVLSVLSNSLPQASKTPAETPE